VSRKTLYYLLFGLSGFAGVMYESLWSHYLKLFLGHAAHAQMLVLMIFMGGMAAGAYLVAPRVGKMRRPLLAYATCEALIGAMALVFHVFYVAATDLSYQSVLPRLHSPMVLHAYKWGLAALLIAPQSVLLGMTFPLMSSGILRTRPEGPGRTLAVLYFTNSMGGAIGVLVCGYVLLATLGHPGTLAIAGALNLAIAAAVWATSRAEVVSEPPREAAAAPTHDRQRGVLVAFLGVSAMTGASSFMYEIGWIRMLGLVVGTYTHAFELMLSAFILGLALGSLVIRRKIDAWSDRRLALGFIQLAMGALALATLVMYNTTFDWMGRLYASIGHLGPEARYVLLQVSSQGLALAIMLPATLCAGMTLPLITRHLLATRYGEKSIGAVYAANTLGAIVGVVLSVQVLLPHAGLKNLMLVGGAIDMALGIALLAGKGSRIKWAPVAATFAVGVVVLVASSAKFDTRRMSSLLFTDAGSRQLDKTILFHKDGKTATVDVIRYSEDGTVSIATNGMSVGLLAPDPNVITLNSTLLAAIPLAMVDSAKTVATFGVGTGYNARVFLSSPTVASVDVIEIEEQMFEGAKYLAPWVSNEVYADPRCHRFVDDAKSFFSWKNSRYDVIVADISYVWVSGVAGLFSKEFYGLVRRHIAPGGLFVQWMHPTSMPLLASVMKALGQSFGNYSVFSAGYFMIIVAGDDTAFERISDSTLMTTGISRFLHENGIDGVADLRSHYLGSRRSLEPLFQSYDVPATSDYHPLLDLFAFRSFVMGESDSFERLSGLRRDWLPIIDILENRHRTGRTPAVNDEAPGRARILFDYFTTHAPLPPAAIMVRRSLQVLIDPPGRDPSASPEGVAAGAHVWMAALEWLWSATAPYLTNDEIDTLLDVIAKPVDFKALPPPALQLFSLLSAINKRDFRTVQTIAKDSLAYYDPSHVADSWQLPAVLIATVQLGDGASAREMLAKYTIDENRDVALRLLLAKARQLADAR
jgi:spermidine synthase